MLFRRKHQIVNKIFWMENMKKIILLLIMFFISVFLFAEDIILKINFQPNIFVEKTFDFISEYKYEKCSELVKCLNKSKKIIFPIFISKAEIWEGTYTLSIYDENKCLGIYTVINEDIIYDEQRKCFRSAKNILIHLRSFLYIEYLRN